MENGELIMENGELIMDNGELRINNYQMGFCAWGGWVYNRGCQTVCLQTVFLLFAAIHKLNNLRARGPGISATLERLKSSGAYGLATCGSIGPFALGRALQRIDERNEWFDFGFWILDFGLGETIQRLGERNEWTIINYQLSIIN